MRLLAVCGTYEPYHSILLRRDSREHDPHVFFSAMHHDYEKLDAAAVVEACGWSMLKIFQNSVEVSRPYSPPLSPGQPPYSTFNMALDTKKKQFFTDIDGVATFIHPRPATRLYVVDCKQNCLARPLPTMSIFQCFMMLMMLGCLTAKHFNA